MQEFIWHGINFLSTHRSFVIWQSCGVHVILFLKKVFISIAFVINWGVVIVYFFWNYRMCVKHMLINFCRAQIWHDLKTTLVKRFPMDHRHCWLELSGLRLFRGDWRSGTPRGKKCDSLTKLSNKVLPYNHSQDSIELNSQSDENPPQQQQGGESQMSRRSTPAPQRRSRLTKSLSVGDSLGSESSWKQIQIQTQRQIQKT